MKKHTHITNHVPEVVPSFETRIGRDKQNWEDYKLQTGRVLLIIYINVSTAACTIDQTRNKSITFVQKRISRAF